MIYNEFKLRLPELLLMRVDKIGMSTSIEARVPFLDHELVEFTMDIPMRDKIRGGAAKHLLKKAVRGSIPDEIIDRRKMGFGAPMSQWLRGDFGQRVEAELLSSSLLRRTCFNAAYIRRLCAEHRSGRRDNSLYIWTLFNLAGLVYLLDRSPTQYGRCGMSAWGHRALRLLREAAPDTGAARGGRGVSGARPVYPAAAGAHLLGRYRTRPDRRPLAGGSVGAAATNAGPRPTPR